MMTTGWLNVKLHRRTSALLRPVNSITTPPEGFKWHLMSSTFEPDLQETERCLLPRIEHYGGVSAKQVVKE